MARLFVLAFVAVVLAACQPSTPPSNVGPKTASPNIAPGTFVTITEISPDPKIPLRVGERIKVRVVATYMLEADAGTLALVIQAADNAALGQNMEVISHGNGKSTLEAEFSVPDTKAVQVFVPILKQGQQGGTSIVDSRAYRVEKS